MATFNEKTTAQDVIDALGSEVAGKTFVITGPSQGGIGASAAIHLAKAKPARIVLAGRSLAKIQPVMYEIKGINSSVSVDFVSLDLLDRASVRQAGAEIKRLTDEISALINNAAIMAVEHFTKSQDGVEGQFETNHVGHFLLTSLLMPELRKAKGVVVNVSSLGYMYSGNWDLEDTDFQGGTTYDCWEAYGRSKLVNVLFGIGLGKRMATFGGAAFSVHPGFIPETRLLVNSDVNEKRLTAAFEDAKEKNGGVAPVQRVATIEEGAANLILPALDPKLRKSSGAFITECGIGSVPDWAGGADRPEKLWRLSEKLIGQEVVV
ncbi:Retinol dehydrogenase [Apiospora aurea]|uniref:Retinol dehydrogenase n=1 Tax=Apiospora aurea TaxID=335848 RepID=A0ABR1Q1Q6_9PEZI